jgi:uncharacterized membrane protein YfcA
MSELLIILLTCILATYIGSLTGLGGALIVKPLLTISLGFVSPSQVLVTKIIATSVVLLNSFKYVKKNHFPNINFFYVKYLFIGTLLATILVYIMPLVEIKYESFLQGLLFVFILILVYIQPKIKYEFKERIIILICIGFFTGFIGSFFGISGGSIRIPIMLIFLNVTFKEAMFYSYFVSILSEPLKLVQYTLELSVFNISMQNIAIILLMIGVALIGANIGSNIGNIHNKRISSETNKILFNIVILVFATISFVSAIIF